MARVQRRFQLLRGSADNEPLPPRRHQEGHAALGVAVGHGFDGAEELGPATETVRSLAARQWEVFATARAATRLRFLILRVALLPPEGIFLRGIDREH